MELTIYDIIKGTVLSDKSYQLNKNLKKLVIKVHPHANKPLIKKAVERLFNVKVEKVNCLNRVGKQRRVKQHIVSRPGVKIAIITFKEGYSLNFLDQGEGKNPTDMVNASSDSVKPLAENV